MKFVSKAIFGAALSVFPVKASEHQSDIYYHEKPVLGASMWIFGGDGLAIFSPDGELLKQHRKDNICIKGTDARTGEFSSDCNYFTANSDGHQYVWAASMAGVHAIQAFDIDTGDYAGYVDTCNTPIDMEYQPVRRELYVRCASDDEDSPGEVDVISSATLSANLPVIKFPNSTSTRAYGNMVVHSDMGPSGYSLQYNKPYLTEMDLSSATVKATYDIPKDKGDIYGGYEMVYSPVNEHVFFRARVCCIVDGDEACSLGCEGTSGDTIGVYEFDTVSKQFIDNHNIKEGSGWGATPAASPDGKWIVMMPNDGGEFVRLIKAGANGQSSAPGIVDIAMNFQGGSAGKQAISDVAFIQDGKREILVVSSNTDNNIALVDLDTFESRKLDLAPGVIESTGGGARQVEWAVGTDYVWINGGEADEVYVVKVPGGIASAQLGPTLTGVRSSQILSVNNFERMRAAAMAQGNINTANSVQVSTNPMQKGSGNNSNTLGIVGVVLGALGLAAGLGALALVMSQKDAAAVLEATTKKDVEEACGKSLGSKVVH